MSDKTPNLENSGPKPPTPDELATKYYEEESKKAGGGNPVIKEAIWLSGLTSSREVDREKTILMVVNKLKSVDDSQFGLEKKMFLIDRVVTRNNRFNKTNPYSTTSRQFDSEIYKEMLRPKQIQRKAA